MAHSSHKNKVRIIGGEYRSRMVGFSDLKDLRPTPDFVRERLFNWLGQDLFDEKVLDLFSGSGVLGFEAASRGALSVDMVDNHPKCIESLKENKKLLKADCVEITQSDALSFVHRQAQRNEVYSLIFLDPPFRLEKWPKILTEVKAVTDPYTRIYIESERLDVVKEFIENNQWCILKEGKTGKSRYLLVKAGQNEINDEEELD